MSSFAKFLPKPPMGPRHPSAPPDAPKIVNVERDRKLGDYGKDKLDFIYKEYEEQITVWKNAFEQVLAAFSLAVHSRDTTLEDEERELERDMAMCAMVFDLFTAGSMRFLGAWVQYSFLPNALKRYKFTTKRSGGLNLLEITPVEFSKLQASAFGGIAQDLGNLALPESFKKFVFPHPRKKSYRFDSWAGVNALKADLNSNIDNSAAAVLGKFTDAMNWMIESTEFGTEWAAFGRTEDRARALIRSHFNQLRKEWARDWTFFGRSPRIPDRQLLADQYERALWADYILQRLPQLVRFAAPGSPETERIPRVGTMSGLRPPKLMANAIVKKLKQLNVVIAETNKGAAEQDARKNAGSPRPTATVTDIVDRKYELQSLISWAEGFVKYAPAMTANQFFKEAPARQLEPI